MKSGKAKLKTIYGCCFCGYICPVKPPKPRVTRCPKCKRAVLSSMKSKV